jgi:hypothetical protein
MLEKEIEPLRGIEMMKKLTQAAAKPPDPEGVPKNTTVDRSPQTGLTKAPKRD